MLGRVFEGVMAPDVRRSSGTYYTPAALVRALLDDALAAFVAGRTGWPEALAERRLAERDPVAGALLESVTLLDPAAGSGAFLLGALERLATLTSAARGHERGARRRILQHCLFGVDLSAAGVRLTELRLWLSVIADDPADRPEDIEPLPNLDCLIRQGDSLFEPFGAGSPTGRRRSRAGSGRGDDPPGAGGGIRSAKARPDSSAPPDGMSGRPDFPGPGGGPGAHPDSRMPRHGAKPRSVRCAAWTRSGAPNRAGSLPRRPPGNPPGAAHHRAGARGAMVSLPESFRGRVRRGRLRPGRGQSAMAPGRGHSPGPEAPIDRQVPLVARGGRTLRSPARSRGRVRRAGHRAGGAGRHGGTASPRQARDR